MPQAKRLPPAKSKSLALSREQQIERQALSMTNETSALVLKVNKLTRADVETEKALVLFRNEVIKTGIAEVHAAFDDIVETAKLNYDTARAKRAGYLAPWEKADEAIRAGLNGYYSMVLRLHREEQERADREQAERERLAAIQREHERLKLEKKIDALPNNSELITKYVAQWEELEGPQPISPPVIVSQPETTGLMNQQPNWKGAVIEGKEIEVLKQIIDGELPLSIIEFRAPELNKLAKLYKLRKVFNGLKFWNASFVKGVGSK